MSGIVTWTLVLCFGYITALPLALESASVHGFDPRYPEEVPGLFQGDIELSSNPFSRSVVGDLKKRWPIRKIPIVIHSYFGENDRNTILESLREIEENVRVDGKDCITFVNQTDEDFYIYFSTGIGCRSRIGYTGARQGIKLGYGCRIKGIVIHEVLHSLGFYHEQSRPDRDKFVKIIMDNIKEGQKGNFVKLLPPVINTQNLSYDYNSIMHYDRFSFAIDRTKPTIVPLKKDADIGQRIGMSQLDIVQLQRFYGCPERKLVPVITTNPVSVNCTFEAGYCGWKHLFMEPPAKINTWIRWSGGTHTDGTGPKTDHTIRTFEGHYLYSDASDRFLSIAKIQTPEFIAGDYCLIFWYHMYGKEMGSLRVNLVEGKQKRDLMIISGDQGNKWQQMKISITATSNSTIEFESVIGHSKRSDICIDDVLFLNRKC